MDKSKIHILIADDEDDLRTLLRHILTAQGYQITSAMDGEEAIELLKREKFDVALLDIQMPNINGIEVLKYIKEHCPHTKAVMLTGYADLKHAMEAKEFGARDFIGKPYKFEDVLSTIEHILAE